MRKRGVYFFVLDAFIGGAIVLVSLMVVLNSYASSPEKEQPLVILEDLMTYLQNTQVRDFQGNITSQLIKGGNITKTDHTLFEQVAEFHYDAEYAAAFIFLQEIVNASLPEQMSVRYFYDNTMMYDRTVFPYAKAGQVLSSKKISMVTINRSFVYGPGLVEVILWTS